MDDPAATSARKMNVKSLGTLGGVVAAVLGHGTWVMGELGKVQSDIAVLKSQMAMVVAESQKRLDNLEDRTAGTDRAVSELARQIERQNTILERLDRRLGQP